MTISRSTLRLTAAALAALCIALPANEAAAWGPRARQMIAAGALPLVRQKAPDAYRGGESTYETDLMRGARDGVPALGGTFPLNTDVQCMDAVQSQIQILREARRNGAGSYFAYRMGGLAALTAETLMPYGIVHGEQSGEMKAAIDDYLETRVEDFSFSVHHPVYQYILNTRLYLEKHRGFHDQDMTLIADDFQRGRGVRGLVAEAGPQYFERSVHAVVDVWYTVLRPAGEASDVGPSREQMALYYIEEVKYLLRTKENFQFAEEAYKQFQRYNPGMPMAFITLGDAFYEFGTNQGIARGVAEWVRAYDIPGEPRKDATARLSKHYLDRGESLFERAHGPLAKETDLDDALQAFNDALRYDRGSDVAASRIQETTIAKNRRKEEYETQGRFIGNALTAMQQAERAALEKDYASAITSYNQAQMLVGLVTDQFKDLSTKSRDTSGEINKAIKTVISEVFASANDSIGKGDAALANNNVDEAIRFYSMVESIVDTIPSEEGSLNDQKKKDMVKTAQNLIDEAELQRRRLEQQQQQEAATPPALPIKKN
jgi:tetratricopeptide (TPR) repeat protein